MLYRFCTFSRTENRLYRKQGARDVDARRAVGVVYKRGGVYMSDMAFNAVLNDVDSFSYNQCVLLLARLTKALQNWTSKDSSDDLFYSKSNIEHLERGIKALNEGKGVEHELIEVV